MRVLLDPVHAVPALQSAAPTTRKRLKAALKLLATDPSGTSNHLDVKRLDAQLGQPVYRLRIGEWRIAFTVDKDLVVLRIFHRRDGYGWLADME